MPSIIVKQDNGSQWIVSHCETVIPNKGTKDMTTNNLVEILERCEALQERFTNYLSAGGKKEYFSSIEEFEWHEANSRSLAKAVKDLSKVTSVTSAPKKGVVYLAKGNGSYKIGRSSNFEVREYHLTLKLPFPVEIVHVIRADDSVFIERFWHTRFSSKRIRGEWFDLDEVEILEFTKHTEM